MIRPHQIAVVFALLFALSCDSTTPTAAQAVSTEHVEAWEKLKERTETGKYFRRVEALDEYLKTDPPSKYLIEAKAMRKKYQRMAEKQVGFDAAIEAVKEAKLAAGQVEEVALWESGDIQDLRPVLVRSLVSDYRIHSWGKTLDLRYLPGRNGTLVEYTAAARLDPVRFRHSLRSALNRFGADLDENCISECLNDSLDRNLFKTLGGEIFLGMGRIDGVRLDKVAEAFWLEPDEELMGIKGRLYWDVFGRVPKDLYTTRMAVKDYGDDKALKAFRDVHNKMKGPSDRTMLRHYRFWTREAGFTQTLEGKIEFKLIDVYVGFWLRRLHDGTEPVVMKWVNKALETYEPEFLAEFEKKAE